GTVRGRTPHANLVAAEARAYDHPQRLVGEPNVARGLRTGGPGANPFLIARSAEPVLVLIPGQDGGVAPEQDKNEAHRCQRRHSHGHTHAAWPVGTSSAVCAGEFTHGTLSFRGLAAA